METSYKVVYVAGPYRDKRGEYYVRENIKTAETYSLEIWKMGDVAVICPHKNMAGLGGAYNLPDEIWLKGGLEFIKRCDAVFVLPDYMRSSGTRAEIEWAEQHKIPVFYSLHDLFMWIDGGRKNA